MLRNEAKDKRIDFFRTEKIPLSFFFIDSVDSINIYSKMHTNQLDIMTHIFNPITGQTKADRVSSRLARDTE